MTSYKAADDTNTLLNTGIENMLSNEQYSKDVSQWVRNTYQAEKASAIKPSKQYIQGSIQAIAEHLNNVATQINSLLDMQVGYLEEMHKQANEMGNRIRVSRELQGHLQQYSAHAARPVHRGVIQKKADPSSFPGQLPKFHPDNVRFDETPEKEMAEEQQRKSREFSYAKHGTLKSITVSHRSDTTTGLVSGMLPLSTQGNPGPPPGIAGPGSPPKVVSALAQLEEEEDYMGNSISTFPGPLPSLSGMGNSGPGLPPSVYSSSSSSPSPVASSPMAPAAPIAPMAPAAPMAPRAPTAPSAPNAISAPSAPIINSRKKSAALMDHIRQGVSLKKVDSVPSEQKEESRRGGNTTPPRTMTMAEEMEARLKARGKKY